MPNLKKHATAGATIGGGTNLIWQLLKMYDSSSPPRDFGEVLERINFGELAIFVLGGAACASLPDILEPATNAQHRAMFHSWVCGGCVAYGAFGNHTKTLSPDERHALQVAALSYLSHLLLDNGTPDGLPLTGLTRTLS